jgi:hypothetical protein
MPEVDRLLVGHQPVGNWSLGQVCNHLAGGIILSVDGFPTKAPWVLRKTVGPIVWKRVSTSGRMPEGVKIPEGFEPKPDLDDRAEVEALRAAIQAFGMHTGPLAAHPFFGPLSHKDWERFHLIHAAHHLSYVLPAPVGSDGTSEQ